MKISEGSDQRWESDVRIWCLLTRHIRPNVRVVTEADKGCGIVKPRTYSDVDGLVTDIPGICLVTFYADCVPLYFVDPVKKVIGLSHSGWRGTVGKIGKVTVETMCREFKKQTGGYSRSGRTVNLSGLL